MRFLRHFITCYPFSCAMIVIIWVLCFCTPPSTPLDNISYIDKWEHTLMYLFTCGVIWTEYVRRHKRADGRKLFLWAWLAPVVMSGVIELMQAYCTGGRRSGDWLDFAANATGCTLAALIGILLVKWRAKG